MTPPSPTTSTPTPEPTPTTTLVPIAAASRPDDDPREFRAGLDELFGALRDAVTETARLIKRVGQRVDTLSLELARDVGAVARDAQAFASAARTAAAETQDRASTIFRATPRAARLAQAGAALLARHRWLRLQAAARGAPGLSDDDHRDLARRTTAIAAELRGGIAKLGQLASCRPDLIGPIWAGELATLQDDVPAVEVGAIRARIEAELGRPIAEVFATFDDEPLAAASLAQVHAATLLDGTSVVVKVQVPGIEDVIAADIAALRTITSALGELPGVDLPTLADELSRALATELDYVEEARALGTFAGTGTIVPRPIAEASTGRVLVMTRIEGERLTVALARMSADERDRLLGALVDEVAAQILVRGHVHADPHPGNFFVTPAGELALLDFGCTLELPRAERAAYARLVIAIAGGNTAAAAHELEALGFSADAPEQLVAVTTSLIGALRPGTAVSELDWEAAFATQIAQARQLGGLTIPRSFVLLGRVLATVAGLLATYKPRLEIHPMIARHLAAAIT